MNTSNQPAAPSRPLQLDPATTLIRVSEVVAIVGLARPTIYKLMRQPESGFPLPVPLSNSTARGAPVAWVLAEVQEWVRARIAARGRSPA
ncbi:Prophage CP4-57 regulatory protein (AlpA) [compost metagenome]